MEKGMKTGINLWAPPPSRRTWSSVEWRLVSDSDPKIQGADDEESAGCS